ncbi:glycerol dehydratase reactivase beta/small subunit family protein [uncultured Secundilactobacillus sp.]|uniref:glycerol dehydratase reactivase beta/small subunit family protein n=1 Tax=uncultured Secundilactobacillus sp. TaxID=2813935 RepID=UPI00258F3690|nr:glycerol dehydratase reactivase beta/small subunit family protein [uncultured Secundilactobacillus sp.]
MIETDKRIPSIVLAVSSSDADLSDLEDLFNGIEEEEIPVSVSTIEQGNTVSNAYQAALVSKLSVGLAFDATQVVLHYKNLDEEEPLFKVKRGNPTIMRMMGTNAARLVKGTPFKLGEGSEFE